MKRFPGCLALLALTVSSSALSQTTLPAPVGAGAQAPGRPAGMQRLGCLRGMGRVHLLPKWGRPRFVAASSPARRGAPLRRATIALSEVGGQLRRATTTDAEGRFDFRELPAGRFSVTATKAGYVTLLYGQRRPYETARR